MTPDPVCLPDTAALAECARALLDGGMRHLVIIDEEGKLTGVLHEHAVFGRGRLTGRKALHFLASTPDDARMLAGDLASQVGTFPRTAELSEVLTYMVENSEDIAVIVEDESVPVGVFSEIDAARLAVERLDAKKRVGARKVVTVPYDASVQEAHSLMLDNAVGHLPVIRDGKLVGVLSWHDLLLDDLNSMGEGAVRWHVRKAPRTVRIGTALRDAAQVMLDHGIGSLPVLDEHDALVGIVTLTDLLAALI